MLHLHPASAWRAPARIERVARSIGLGICTRLAQPTWCESLTPTQPAVHPAGGAHVWRLLRSNGDHKS